MGGWVGGSGGGAQAAFRRPPSVTVSRGLCTAQATWFGHLVWPRPRTPPTLSPPHPTSRSQPGWRCRCRAPASSRWPGRGHTPLQYRFRGRCTGTDRRQTYCADCVQNDKLLMAQRRMDWNIIGRGAVHCDCLARNRSRWWTASCSFWSDSVAACFTIAFHKRRRSQYERTCCSAQGPYVWL